MTDGEYSGYKTLKRYRSREQVLDLLAGETGLRLEKVKSVKGDTRRLVIELLWGAAGYKNN